MCTDDGSKCAWCGGEDYRCCSHDKVIAGQYEAGHGCHDAITYISGQGNIGDNTPRCSKDGNSGTQGDASWSNTQTAVVR